MLFYSVIIVLIILFTTVPLGMVYHHSLLIIQLINFLFSVKKCSMILLQSVPSEVDLDAVTEKTSNVLLPNFIYFFAVL